MVTAIQVLLTSSM